VCDGRILEFPLSMTLEPLLGLLRSKNHSLLHRIPASFDFVKTAIRRVTWLFQNGLANHSTVL
jgi:hypothetical protein